MKNVVSISPAMARPAIRPDRLNRMLHGQGPGFRDLAFFCAREGRKRSVIRFGLAEAFIRDEVGDSIVHAFLKLQTTVICAMTLFAAEGIGSGSESENKAGPSAPFHLRCEGLLNPLGIDAELPRFSWWIGDTRPDAAQSAWQIEIRDGESVRWDSGKMQSDQSTGVACDGPTLAPLDVFTWRVRTWDGDGVTSAWSESASFGMGLLDPSDWSAQWIGHPPRFTRRSVPAVFLRRDFEVTGPVMRARLFISARGLFEARVNGTPGGGGCAGSRLDRLRRPEPVPDLRSDRRP